MLWWQKGKILQINFHLKSWRLLKYNCKMLDHKYFIVFALSYHYYKMTHYIKKNYKMTQMSWWEMRAYREAIALQHPHFQNLNHWRINKKMTKTLPFFISHFIKRFIQGPANTQPHRNLNNIINIKICTPSATDS